MKRKRLRPWELFLARMDAGTKHDLCHWLLEQQFDMGMDSHIRFVQDDYDKPEGFEEHFMCAFTGKKIPQEVCDE